MNESGYLLDSSVLIALGASSHELHLVVMNWMLEKQPPFATCPITQGALLRISMKAGGLSYAEGQCLLDSIVRHPKHQFIPDSIPYQDIDGNGIVGHQQITDAYLAALARSAGLKLATLDRAQAALHPDIAELVSMGRRTHRVQP